MLKDNNNNMVFCGLCEIIQLKLYFKELNIEQYFSKKYICISVKESDFS